ncbi:DUF4181 domain-containing protein [Radiobacillus sp. PE A8.2]|uniref:DUF4181 domain-containing protein n=1 Tax=Radiobacillus sp. PE A8.2 TaxID=3380349 RepID=UPI00388E45A5
MFSDNYINDLHRKSDKWVRNISAITLGILIFFQLFYYEDLIYLFPIGVILFTALNYSVTVFFEWKYSEHPKQEMLTITEMFLVSLTIILVLHFELLGSFNEDKKELYCHKISLMQVMMFHERSRLV